MSNRKTITHLKDRVKHPYTIIRMPSGMYWTESYPVSCWSYDYRHPDYRLHYIKEVNLSNDILDAYLFPRKTQAKAEITSFKNRVIKRYVFKDKADSDFIESLVADLGKAELIELQIKYE